MQQVYQIADSLDSTLMLDKSGDSFVSVQSQEVRFMGSTFLLKVTGVSDVLATKMASCFTEFTPVLWGYLISETTTLLLLFDPRSAFTGGEGTPEIMKQTGLSNGDIKVALRIISPHVRSAFVFKDGWKQIGKDQLRDFLKKSGAL